MQADPARQEGRLLRLLAALGLDGWRRFAIGFLPLVVALVLALVESRGWLRPADVWYYDLITLNESGRMPAVAIVESDDAFEASGAARHAELARSALSLGARRVAFRFDPALDPARDNLPINRIVVARQVEKVPGRQAWRFVGTGPAVGVIAGARVLAPAERGLHRRQLARLPGEHGPLPVFESAAAGRMANANPYLLRLSRHQNVPRLRASQIVARQVGVGTLSGTVVVVEPPASIRQAQVLSPRDRPGAATSLTEFNALAIQTLVNGRAVRQLAPLESTLLLIAVALVSGLLFLRADPKRIMPPVLGGGLATLALLGWLALTYGNVLLPVTALVIAQPLAALLVLYRAELGEDRDLRRFVTQTLNLYSRQVLLKDLGRLPQFLGSGAAMLGISSSIVFEVDGGRLELLEADKAKLDDLLSDKRQMRTLLRRARRSDHPVDGAALAPGWPGTVRLAALGPARGEVYWLYGFAPGKDHSAALQAAAVMAADYRTIQQLRADLGAAGDRRHRYRPADEWAGGAVRLIAGHGAQVSDGLDRLETAVMVFHPIGFPVHANAPMTELYALLGQTISETTIAQLLGALTELDRERVMLIVNDLLLHGGEMRIGAREIDARTRQVRVAAAQDLAGGRSQTLVVEVVDISEPQRLAQLRLGLSNLLDVSIRNDLEAVGFALAAARSGKLPADRLARVFDQIARATERASSRLDELAPHLQPQTGMTISQSFPIDAVAAVEEARKRVAPLAAQHGMEISGDRPGIAGFTIADPKLLADMVEAMLAIVLTDSAPGEPVRLDVHEEDKRTVVIVTGGIGMAFERLYAALETSTNHNPGPFRAIAQGMAAALGWGAVVSYSSRVGKGYRFVIEMRRIG